MFELVHTTTKCYDGPREGIADFRGSPHFYQSRWSDIGTDQEDTFLLMPIDAETLELALEDWRIWHRWEIAFHHGQTPEDTHPTLPEDRERHSNIRERSNTLLTMDEAKAFCVSIRDRGLPFYDRRRTWRAEERAVVVRCETKTTSTRSLAPGLRQPDPLRGFHER